MRLAIGLIAYLAVTCILATLVPQGLADDEYRAMYPKIVAQLVVQTGFGGFFGSILFIIPAFLFFANLSACTVKRFVRELRKKAGRRHGPDILHVGLMALVIGSIWSFSGHQQGSVTLAPGDGVNLPDGAVEIQAQGEEENVREMEKWLRRGPPMARVTRCTAIERPLEKEEAAFTIRHF